jgi:hypothetical protein
VVESFVVLQPAEDAQATGHMVTTTQEATLADAAVLTVTEATTAAATAASTTAAAVTAATTAAAAASTALADATVAAVPLSLPTTTQNASVVMELPVHHHSQTVTIDKWPFRLDISTEYQDWILVGMSIVLVALWCLPCICGKMRNKTAKGFTKWVYTRLNVYFWWITYINMFILMFTIGVLPDWTVNEYFQWMMAFITWVLVHLKKMCTSAAILIGFFLLIRFQEKILVAAGLEHVKWYHFSWREMLGLPVRKRPIELFIWKVEDLHNNGAKIYKPNDVFVECHLGDNEPMRTRVHNNAGTSCTIKESFQMNINESESNTLMTLLVKDQALMVSTELARLVLSIREVCGIEDQTGKRRVHLSDFNYSEDHFVALSLRPHGQIWIAIAPVEDMDEEKKPLMREDEIIQC